MDEAIESHAARGPLVDEELLNSIGDAALEASVRYSPALPGA
jgi:hypothetical protein